MSTELRRWSGYLVAVVAMVAGFAGCQSETGLQGHCDDRYVVQGGRGQAVGAPECPPREGQCLTQSEACEENVCGGVDDRCGGIIDCGTCEGSCEDVELDCGDNGQCEDNEEGVGQCVCDEGFEQPYCLPPEACLTQTKACTEGVCGALSDRCGGIVDCGACEGSCDEVELDCGEHGQCEDDADGNAQCVCDEGFDGPLCLPSDVCLSEAEACTEGVCGGVENGCGGILDCGACEGSCDEVALDCGDHGRCVEDAEGDAQCACDEGRAEPFCRACGEGFVEVDGQCRPDCAVFDPECSGHGSCEIDEGSGVGQCECTGDRVGGLCEACPEGTQDNDDDGVCAADCEAAGLACGVGGVCDDSSGETVCACRIGFAGELCESCDEGYQDLDNDGECRLGCDNATIEVCPPTQVCDDSSGIAECLCTEGAECESCDEGFALLEGTCVFAPQGCDALLSRDPDAADGLYELFYEGDPLQPWAAYCADMESGEPVEYLPFARTGVGRNFASFTNRLIFLGASTRTYFSAVRIDPVTLTIDINDFRFATTEVVGTPDYQSIPVTQMPFGTAATCGIVDSTSGNIDLRGTPFRVQSNFCSSTNLDPVFRRDRQVVDLRIGLLGCYWMAPNPCPDEIPINDFGDSQVVLEYRGF